MFAAIRGCGGLNINPYASQFRRAYRCLLERNHVKKGTGNCLLHDNIDILDSTLAKGNVARRVDVNPVLLPEKDTLADLRDVDDLSDTGRQPSATSQASSRKRSGKIPVCSQALTSDGLDSTHPLLVLKNRGGLQNEINQQGE